jgi:ATP-dependent exoDNAse (exonuclease V) alpha subunit
MTSLLTHSMAFNLKPEVTNPSVETTWLSAHTNTEPMEYMPSATVIFSPPSKFSCASYYDQDVFNGDVGIVEGIDMAEQKVAVRFDERLVKYDFGELDEISLAYAITIHKSQGSEFPAVVIPLATQHHMLLQRNLIYTGITRGKRLLVLIGQKKALGIAVRNDRPQRRYSGLLASLRGDRRAGMD